MALAVDDAYAAMSTETLRCTACALLEATGGNALFTSPST